MRKTALALALLLLISMSLLTSACTANASDPVYTYPSQGATWGR